MVRTLCGRKGAFCLINDGPRIVRAAIAGLHRRFRKVGVMGCESKCVGSSRRGITLVRSVSRGGPSIIFITVKSPGRRLLVRRVTRHRPTICRKLKKDFSICANGIGETPG